MARGLRTERVGGWYHLTARGNERRDIYRDDRDRRHFLELLEEMVERFRIGLHAYVLMSNHYHLLVELRELNLSRAMQWLNVSYSVWFNRRHGRSGHLFQGRFKSVVVSRDEWALGLSRYIHLNPVRVEALGLGKRERRASRQGLGAGPTADQVQARIASLRRYRWSSFRAYVGSERSPAWLERDAVYALGGGRKAEQPRRYRDYVEREVREGMKATPWESLRDRVVLGSRDFVAKLVGDDAGSAASRRLEKLHTQRPDWATIVRAVERVKKGQWDEIRERHGDTGRDLALYLGRGKGGFSLRKLAEMAGLTSAAAVAMSLRRYSKRLSLDTEQQEQLNRATQLLIVRS